MPKSALKPLVFLLLSCLLLSACGNKGPLVRPAQSEAVKAPVESGAGS